MAKINQKLIDLKWQVRGILNCYPLLFYPLAQFMYQGKVESSGNPSLNQLVSKDTQLVIESFQRTSNTFAVKAFKYAQPNQVKLAYHFHAPAQILRAVQLGIPTLVLIRKPIDTVASFVARWTEVSIEQALKLYILFYRAIRQYKESYVIADFTDVTQEYAKIISRINSKFGTDFVPFSDLEADRKKVLAEIVIDQSSFANSSGSKKEKIIQEILAPKHEKLLREAEKIYQEFTLQSLAENPLRQANTHQESELLTN